MYWLWHHWPLLTLKLIRSCFCSTNSFLSSLSSSRLSLILFYSVHLTPLSPNFYPLPCPSHLDTNTQDCLCSVGEVLEGNGGGVYGTVGVLLSMAPATISPSPRVQLAGFALFYLSVMSVLCAIYVHLAPRVWSQPEHKMFNQIPHRQHIQG